VFLGEDLMTSGREYSDETARMIDEEISRILTEQEQRANDLLVKHRKGLDLVAEALLEQETIDGALVARLIQKGIDRNVEGNSSSDSSGRPEHDTL
jgi:cell division protease FtsH